MIVIVLGMHRSGTSTVSGVLHLNNIIMGNYENFWPRPLPQNPKGFYENYDFRLINDRILSFNGYDVKSYNPQIPQSELKDGHKNKMKKLITCNQDNYQNWGWKDPRTCLTIENWMEIFSEMDLEKEIKIIFITRDAISVARSLTARNQLPLNQGLELWFSYTKRALDFCSKNNIATFYMSFENILEIPEENFKNMFSFLSYSFEPKIVNKFVDKTISKNSSGEEIILPEKIIALEKDIDNLL